MATILDHAGNTMRHGLPDDEREWSLEGRAKKKDAEGGSVSIRLCPVCFAAQSIGREVCVHCGAAFPVKHREIERVEGELVEVDPEQMRMQYRKEQWRADTLTELIELGKRRGYRHAYRWARHVMSARQRRRLMDGT